MCLVITAKGGARPSDDRLESAARSNSDGAGVAWIEEVEGESMVHWEKGLDVDDVKRLNQEMPHPYIIHFRAQSTGDATDNLCHPFPINERADDDLSGHAKRVLFHNGTATDWKDYFRSFIASRPVDHFPQHGFDRMSDTRALAYMVYHATQFAEADPDTYRARLQAEKILQIFATGSRFGVLDADAYEHEDQRAIRHIGTWWYRDNVESEDEAHIVHEGSDDTLYEGGLRYSNKSRGTVTT